MRGSNKKLMEVGELYLKQQPQQQHRSPAEKENKNIAVFVARKIFLRPICPFRTDATH
jgi:hypothetical protein